MWLRAVAPLFALACAPTRASVPVLQVGASAPERVDFVHRPFLRIDGEAIPGDLFVDWLVRTLGEPYARDFALKYRVVDREAQRLGLVVPPEEIERTVEGQFQKRIAGAFLGSPDEWRAELARTGRSEAGVRRQRIVEVRPELEARAIAALDRIVPEHVVEREWELRYGRKGRRYDLRMILFRVVVPSPHDMTQAEWEAGRKKAMEEMCEKARTVRERALHGEDFGTLASETSDDPDTRNHRGAVTGGFRHFGWPHVFLDALEKLEPGQILEPTYARGGFWIVELRSVEVTPLSRVRDAITADLLARGPEPYEVGMVMDRLADGVRWEVLPSMHAERLDFEELAALEPVMSVEGEPVSRGEYARWLVDTIGETLVDPFAEEWLARRKARAEGIAVDEKDVEARAREYLQSRIDSGYHGSREAWITYLAMLGRTEADLVEEVTLRARLDLITEALYRREKKVRPEDVRARYLADFGENGRRIETRMILLPIRPPDLATDRTREDLDRLMESASESTRLRAEALVARARAGEDFAALAREASEDPRTKDSGGLLPGRFHADQWPKAVGDEVLTLAPGGISTPARHGGAWVIFQVVAVRSVKFEEVEKDLEEDLRNERPLQGDLAAYRNVLRKQARVEVLPAFHE